MSGVLPVFRNGMPYAIPDATDYDEYQITNAGGWYPIGLTWAQLTRWMWTVESWELSVEGAFSDLRMAPDPNPPPSIPYPSGEIGDLLAPPYAEKFPAPQNASITEPTGIIIATGSYRSASFTNVLNVEADELVQTTLYNISGILPGVGGYGGSSTFQLFNPTANFGVVPEIDDYTSSPNPIVKYNGLYYPALFFGGGVAGYKSDGTAEWIQILSDFNYPYYIAPPPVIDPTYTLDTSTSVMIDGFGEIPVAIWSSLTTDSVSLDLGPIAMNSTYPLP